MTTPLIFWDVDTQFDFMDPSGALYVPGAEELSDNLTSLTRAAMELSIPVIAGADDHELTDPEISTEPDSETTFPPHCMRGTPGAERVPATRLEWTLELGLELKSSVEIREQLKRPWPRVLIHKKATDVFTNPNTDVVLEVLRPEQIVVYGVALDFCERLVVEGLLDRGYRDIVVLTDATRPIHADRGRELFEHWSSLGVVLETTDRLLSRILHQPRVAAI